MRGISGVFAMALALAACGTPGGLRSGQQGTQILDQTTAKAPQAVAGCIGDKLEGWNGTHKLRLSTRPTAAGFSISGDDVPVVFGATNGADTVLLIDISQEGAATRVKVATHFFVGDGRTELVPLVTSCL